MSIKPSLPPLYKKRNKNIIVTMKDKDKSSNISIIILTFASVAIALIMLTFIFMDKLDSQIKKRIDDPAFIHKITSDIRPFLFFDANSIIYKNFGAAKYLDDKTQ